MTTTVAMGPRENQLLRILSKQPSRIRTQHPETFRRRRRVAESVKRPCYQVGRVVDVTFGDNTITTFEFLLVWQARRAGAVIAESFIPVIRLWWPLMQL